MPVKLLSLAGLSQVASVPTLDSAILWLLSAKPLLEDMKRRKVRLVFVKMLLVEACTDDRTESSGAHDMPRHLFRAYRAPASQPAATGAN